MRKKVKSFVLVLFLSAIFGLQNSELIVPGYDCSDCHSSGGWEKLTFSGFNHGTTGFSLKGIHKIQNCFGCHLGETNVEKHQFQKENSECTSCHIDVHKSELGNNCLQCHTEQTWTVNSQSFDHNQTQFPLLNGHKGVLCNQCHFGESSSQFTATPTDCYSCHLNDFSLTGTNQYPESMDHTALNYSQDCLLCHTTNKWKDAIFDHDQTDFSLLGAHETTDCQSCHANGNYDLPLSCDGCHIENGIATSNASLSEYDHVSHQINANCESCHTSIIWSSLIFDHLNFSNQNCEECHLPEHTDSQDPPHAGGNIDTDCQLCHATTSNWDISPFAHTANQTGYLLEGAHTNANCTSCHLNNVFASTAQDCYSCHASDYEATGTETYPNAPDHQALSYGQSCNVCHSMEQWTEAIFDHDETEFPLLGAHETTDCQSCHANGNYDLPLSCDGCHIENGIATSNASLSEYDHVSHQINANCESCHTSIIWSSLIFDHLNFSNQNCEECHLPEHTDSQDPPHGNDNIQDNCELCHESTSTWIIENFLHNSSQTGFELTGLHIPADCALCHLNQVYNSTPQSCANSICHLNEFNATTDPNHGEYGFPVGYCEHCHVTLGWEPDIFSHDVEDACATCHMPDYNSADDPSHDGFSTTCEDCHTSTTTWDGATFSHVGITDGCQNCHLDDYQSTPSHVNFVFPLNCEMCHTTTDWDDATFNHDNDYFPIFSGEHEDEWTTCTAECHIIPEDFSQFSCGLNGVCHEHNQTDMDDEHDDENDYVYESSACYNCHPNGEEDDDDDDDDLRQIRFKREKAFMKKFPNYLPQ